MTVRLLDLIKPFASITPEAEYPYPEPDFDEKVIYTIAVGAIYLVLGLPMNGVHVDKIADPFFWLRDTFASQKGTLLELGLLSAVTSSFLWQIAAALRLVNVNFSLRSDRALFQTLQKITSVLLGVGYGVALIFSGYFTASDLFASTDLGSSTTAELAFSTKITLLTQIVGSSFVVNSLIELLDKGLGFGPGIPALTCISAATEFASGFVGLIGHSTPAGTVVTDGALIQLFRNFFSKSFTTAIYEAFYRTDGTNLTQIYLTIAVTLIVIYTMNIRYDVSVKSTKVRSPVSTYPIKLLYCGAIPLIYTYSVLYNLNIAGFVLSHFFSEQTALFATYDETKTLTGGLLFFLSPGTGPIRPFTYAAFVIVVSTLFGSKWPAISGAEPKDVAKLFKRQDIQIAGHRDHGASKELQKLIPTAATLGSFIVAALAASFEAAGEAKGLVYGTIVGVLSGWAVLEMVITEWQQTGAASSSQLSQFISTQ